MSRYIAVQIGSVDKKGIISNRFIDKVYYPYPANIKLLHNIELGNKSPSSWQSRTKGEMTYLDDTIIARAIRHLWIEQPKNGKIRMWVKEV